MGNDDDGHKRQGPQKKSTYYDGHTEEDYDGQNHAGWVLILNVCIKVFSLSYSHSNNGYKHDGAKKITRTANEIRARLLKFESVGRIVNPPLEGSDIFQFFTRG